MGTRAEIIKMSRLYHALHELHANPVVWHIGQHEELAWPFYEFFGISPELHLPLDRQKHTLGHLSALILDNLDDALNSADPSCMVVQGDTSSALMAALSAYYYQIPIAHVEAGLRTFREYEPFPEEKNRELIARLAHWHFAPTEEARNNLLAERIQAESIHVVGNTIVDATLWGVQHLENYRPSFTRLGDDFVKRYEDLSPSHRLIVVTAHRRESWDKGIAEIAMGIRAAVEQHPDIFIVWPIHPNPIIQDAVYKIMERLSDEQLDRVLLTTPLDYPEMLQLLKDCWLILTDSGGIQEEAITLGTPVLVLRGTTERPEVIQAGGGELIGASSVNIIRWIQMLSENEDKYASMCNRPNPFGNGDTSKLIAELLVKRK